MTSARSRWWAWLLAGLVAGSLLTWLFIDQRRAKEWKEWEEKVAVERAGRAAADTAAALRTRERNAALDQAAADRTENLRLRAQAAQLSMALIGIEGQVARVRASLGSLTDVRDSLFAYLRLDTLNQQSIGNLKGQVVDLTGALEASDRERLQLLGALTSFQIQRSADSLKIIELRGIIDSVPKPRVPFKLLGFFPLPTCVAGYGGQVAPPFIPPTLSHGVQLTCGVKLKLPKF